MNILCFFFLHGKKEYHYETVLKDSLFNLEVQNVIVKCKRCGEIVDEYGITTGKISFKVKV